MCDVVYLCAMRSSTQFRMCDTTFAASHSHTKLTSLAWCVPRVHPFAVRKKRDGDALVRGDG